MTRAGHVVGVARRLGQRDLGDDELSLPESLTTTAPPTTSATTTAAAAATHPMFRGRRALACVIGTGGDGRGTRSGPFAIASSSFSQTIAGAGPPV